jgi:hypothetical protein
MLLNDPVSSMIPTMKRICVVEWIADDSMCIPSLIVRPPPTASLEKMLVLKKGPVSRQAPMLKI